MPASTKCSYLAQPTRAARGQLRGARSIPSRWWSPGSVQRRPGTRASVRLHAAANPHRNTRAPSPTSPATTRRRRGLFYASKHDRVVDGVSYIRRRRLNSRTTHPRSDRGSAIAAATTSPSRQRDFALRSAPRRAAAWHAERLVRCPGRGAAAASTTYCQSGHGPVLRLGRHCRRRRRRRRDRLQRFLAARWFGGRGRLGCSGGAAASGQRLRGRCWPGRI